MFNSKRFIKDIILICTLLLGCAEHSYAGCGQGQKQRISDGQCVNCDTSEKCGCPSGSNGSGGCNSACQSGQKASHTNTAPFCVACPVTESCGCPSGSNGSGGCHNGGM